MQKYNKQKNIYLQAIEHKKHLEQKILQTQILQEKIRFLGKSYIKN